MKVLVANRGEIACRIFRTLKHMGVRSVAVHSQIDTDAPHTWLADEVVAMGEPRSYLDMKAILVAARDTGATAIHPGYGFLAENPVFAEAVTGAGLTFIGPSSHAMRVFGDKQSARELAERAGVPVVPGARDLNTQSDAERAAADIGYPVLLKAAAGGGGKGMRRVDSAAGIADAFAAASREAEAAFADARLLLEKYVTPARHIEVQILADGKRAVALGERECSLQRRYQKLVEESPSIGIDDATRQQLMEAAVKLTQEAGYSGAGTVEFVVGADGSFYFLEVNARLQVEHPVTELCTGLDLVEHQLTVAHGGGLPENVSTRGHAIEVRLNAEDAYHGFLPASGRVAMLHWPSGPGVRIDTGIVEGSEISPHYDSMVGKVVTYGESREQARKRMLAALRDTVVLGVTTNYPFLIDLLQRPFFVDGQTFTTTVEAEAWEAPPTPGFVHELATSSAPSRRSSGAGGGDNFSPWHRLGAFRMGS